MTAYTCAVEMEFSAGVYTDISADVRASPVRFTFGKNGVLPKDRVADTGILTLTLDNSTSNSGGKLGYYSPDHANVRAGFGLGTTVRIKETWSGTDYYHRYYVSDIEPAAGKYGERATRITAEDYIGKMASQRTRVIPTQTSKRNDQLTTTLVATMPVAPKNTSYATGPDTFTYALHDIREEKTTIMNAWQRALQSGLDYGFRNPDSTDGETLTYQSRHTRTRTASSGTLSDTMVGLKVHQSTQDIINLLHVVSNPVYLSATTEIVYTLRKELSIVAGATISFDARYTDPSGAGKRINIKDGTGVTPVAITDYKMSATPGGSGSDLNGSLVVTVTWYSDYASVSLQNTAAVSGYVNFFQLRVTNGLMRLYDPVDTIGSDATSQTAYGVREENYQLPYQESANVAVDFRDHLIGMWKDPLILVDSVEFIANTSDTLMGYGVTLKLGDRIQIVETVTGINGYYNINFVEKTIQPGNILRVRWTLESALITLYWYLGDAGYSELGDTTYLGF